MRRDRTCTGRSTCSTDEIMSQVFISHSSHNRAFVERELLPLLKSNGIGTWYSRDDIRTAEDWERSILRGLRECDWFLLVMSPQAAHSRWVRDEVHWAMDERPEHVIPLL